MSYNNESSSAIKVSAMDIDLPPPHSSHRPSDGTTNNVIPDTEPGETPGRNFRDQASDKQPIQHAHSHMGRQQRVPQQELPSQRKARRKRHFPGVALRVRIQNEEEAPAWRVMSYRQRRQRIHEGGSEWTAVTRVDVDDKRGLLYLWFPTGEALEKFEKYVSALREEDRSHPWLLDRWSVMWDGYLLQVEGFIGDSNRLPDRRKLRAELIKLTGCRFHHMRWRQQKLVLRFERSDHAFHLCQLEELFWGGQWVHFEYT